VFKDHPVYYVDLKPRIFDAKIFPDDTTHPNGWGTVLVCGMRFGGGVIGTDKDHDGTFEAEDELMHSAYIIMDITDPEQEPEVLAEVTFSDLGFTTSFPAVIYMDPKNGNQWYLVLGSGPIDSVGAFTVALEEASSNQQAKIYIIDLNAVGAGTTPLKDANGSSLPGAGAFQTISDPDSFISDIIAVDYELNYKTNAVYYGTISGEPGAWGGKLRRIVLEDDPDPSNWEAESILIDVEKPISAAPTVATDTDGRFWVYFGTGRFFTRTDVLYTNTQTFHGVREPWTDDNNDGYADIDELDWTTVSDVSDLLDVTDASVFAVDLSVTGVPGVSYFHELLEEVENYDGWYLDFPDSGERNLGQGSLLGDLVTFTTYTPTADVCDFRGTSSLYLLYYKTGTAYYKPVAGTDSQTDEVIKTLDLGEGMTTTPNLFSQDGTNETTAFVQSSTGAIITIDETNPGTTTSGKISWQEEE
jgi:type IV pilus assembly protein PilY1